jgi:hypothetical protein
MVRSRVLAGRLVRGNDRHRASYDDARHNLRMCLIQVRSRDESLPRAGHDYASSHLEEDHANFQTRGRDPSLSPLLKALRGFFQERRLVRPARGRDHRDCSRRWSCRTVCYAHALRAVLKRAPAHYARAYVSARAHAVRRTARARSVRTYVRAFGW